MKKLVTIIAVAIAIGSSMTAEANAKDKNFFSRIYNGAIKPLDQQFNPFYGSPGSSGPTFVGGVQNVAPPSFSTVRIVNQSNTAIRYSILLDKRENMTILPGRGWLHRFSYQNGGQTKNPVIRFDGNGVPGFQLKQGALQGSHLQGQPDPNRVPTYAFRVVGNEISLTRIK